MRFLVDAQLPPALARWLIDRGFSASPVRDVGLRDADDGSIWAFAIAGDWVVVTKDEDFADRWLADLRGPTVVWLRVGNCTNRVLTEWLAPLLPEVIRLLNSGQRLVEVRQSHNPTQ